MTADARNVATSAADIAWVRSKTRMFFAFAVDCASKLGTCDSRAWMTRTT
jgi:hypothetical protein